MKKYLFADETNRLIKNSISSVLQNANVIDNNVDILALTEIVKKQIKDCRTIVDIEMQKVKPLKFMDQTSSGGHGSEVDLINSMKYITHCSDVLHYSSRLSALRRLL